MSSARTLAGLTITVFVLAVAGFNIYRWYRDGRTPLATAFEKTQISRIDTDGLVRLPAISPDGKYVAYVSGEIGNRSIVVRQISTGSEVVVVPPVALAFQALSFSPSGDYLYYTQTSADYRLNTLYQVPALGGIPKKIITDVDSAPTFAPDGKRLAFLRHISASGDDVIFVADVDGSNIHPLISLREATQYDFLTAPAWSPDGTKLLLGAGHIKGGIQGEVSLGEVSTSDGSFRIFDPKKWKTVENLAWFRDGSGFLLTASENEGTPMQIWRVEYPSGATAALTNDVNNYWGVAVALDGKTIITTKADRVSSVWRYAPGTKELDQLMADSPKREGGSGLTQAPDGKLIFSSDEGSETDLWISDGDGKNAHRLTSDAKINQAPVVTPDGRYILFNSSRSGTYRIWRMDIDGKNPIQLSEEMPEASDVTPVITPDGRNVLFTRTFLTDNRISSIMRVPVEGGSSAPVLQDNRHSYFAPAISPDGKHLACMSYDMTAILSDVYVGAFDGSAAGTIEARFANDLMNSVKWSPDSRSLVYVTGRGVPNIWRVSVDGREPQALTDFKSGQIFNYSWSHDGGALLIVRGIVNNDLILIRDAAKSTP